MSHREMYYKSAPSLIGDIVRMSEYIEPNPEENMEVVPDDFLRLAYKTRIEFEITDADDGDNTVMLCCLLTGTIVWTNLNNVELVRRKE